MYIEQPRPGKGRRPLSISAGAAVLTAAAVLGGLGAGASPAFAEGTGTAPACIKRTVSKDKSAVHLFNSCGKTMWVQVDWNNWWDSACTKIAPGQDLYFKASKRNYQRTETCKP